MILGLISFVLFLLKDQKTYDQSDDVLTNTFDVRTAGSDDRLNVSPLFSVSPSLTALYLV